MTKEIIGVEIPYDLLKKSIFSKNKNYVEEQPNLKIQKEYVVNSQNLNILLFSKKVNFKILLLNFYE